MADCNALAQKSKELLDQVHAVAGGIDAGQRLARQLEGCLAALNRAESFMAQALAQAHSVDITVEVPDPEPLQ
ncbi:hypothetical protein [Aestuariimicrobium sp. Y1814]|uniref:hypothetical protein n=1 Tax=Aestuariimicrobium sp. Y1814 TaxID=3418742 RepID=UPI003DA6FCC8